MVVAESTLPPVQALVRWDPVTQAERELAERRELRFPPAVRVAALTGTGTRCRTSSARPSCRRARRCSGRFRSPDGRSDHRRGARGRRAVRMLVRVDRRSGTALACALRAAQAIRSARKDSGVVRLQLDPAELL